MGLYHDETIYKILSLVNEKYFLPDIQRPFVWKQDQIYALFDSIMRGYPINTFLFWQIKREDLQESNIKKFTFVKNNKEKSDEDLNLNNSDYSLVLDGQQRITSLFMSLRGSYFERKKEKELFFNVLSGNEEDEDGQLFEFKFLDKTNPDYFVDKNKFWLNIKRIYECVRIEDKMNIRRKITEEISSDSLKAAAEQNIEILYSRLRSELIINYYPEEENDYDKVLDIFVRTNSGGTKLTYSDLLFSTIKLRWRDARGNFEQLLNDINGEDFNFDTDFILKACFVFFAETQKDVKYSRKNVDDENKINKIINNWNEITHSIKVARDLLDQAKINHSKLLSSNNVLVPIAYFVFKNKISGYGESNQNRVISPTVKNELITFLLSSLLSGLFGGQSDAVLYLLKQEIDKAQGGVFPLKEIKKELSLKNKSLEITKDFLDNVSYQDRNSYLILNLLHKNVNLNTSSSTNLPEQDHIFSQKELKGKKYSKDEINKIYNLRYLTSTGNKKKSDITFTEWINSITEDEKRKALIPEGEWDADSFPEFMKKRKELIIKELNFLFE